MPHLGPLVESLPVDLLLETLLLCLDQLEYHRSQAEDNGFASAIDLHGTGRCKDGCSHLALLLLSCWRPSL